ncbi:CLN3 protein-domain-containing protein [Flammula alnicola]|nr:CLN3 protein-domain-containing protein [Flammula alnicola]
MTYSCFAGSWLPRRTRTEAHPKARLSFFIFGLINNGISIGFSPPSTPKGIIAFCNIAPSMAAKVCWPYILKGRIRYAKRLSFSSGLGELTFLQLSTTYVPTSIAGTVLLSYFASGTGAAGLVGAFLWWEVRGLGVRIGVGMSSIMPLIIPLTYYFLLPSASAFLYSTTPSAYEDMLSPPQPITSLPGTVSPGPKRGIALSANDKWRLVKPLLPKYMAPLFCFEYTINQGIGPTLLYPVPSAEGHWLLSKIIHTVRDYYPLWQLVYQATVFLSRSSISLGFPALPTRLLPLPAIVQFGILLTLSYESAFGFFGEESESMNIFLGICGGLAYVNVFYRINHEPPDPNTSNDIEQRRQEREFKIGSIGFADSTGILLASILAVPTEIDLCRAQMRRGKMLCKGL